MSTREMVNGADAFSTSARRVVDYLNTHTPISDWSVSRIAGGEQVHVHVHDAGLLTRGRRQPWDDTLCIRMAGGAAQIVPDTLADSDYSDHPDAGTARAYVGMPIVDDEGNMFGTLCGVDTTPLPDADSVDSELVELMRDLLSSQLATSRVADRERRAAEIAEALAHTDVLTGLVNRRGWDLLLEDADQRIAAYADPVAIAVLDLDGLKALNDTEGHVAGDELLRRTGAVLSRVAEAADRVARYGGDEFAILSNNVPVSRLEAHFDRFTDALTEAGIRASIGFAATQSGVVGAAAAFVEADASMYAAKLAGRAG